ncbi:LacI family transcriptional regulator, partial [Desulfovibrio sp. OttesenSCG-928-I05]|nr:LacI family transcriptional regulator [Desulfovibrio sp. OttesenSCG-928-I05]
VSVMTVSNFVNGKFGMMGEKTRGKIQAVLEEMPYRPHSSARNLRLSRYFSVGQVVVDESPFFMTRRVIGSIMAGLAQELNGNGYSLTVQRVPGKADADVAPVLRNQLTDGLCVMLSGSYQQQEALLDFFCSLGQPLVLLQKALPSPREDVCVVRMNERNGGVILAELLVSKGAKRLLMMTSAVAWPSLDERVSGVQEVVLGSGGGVVLELLPVPESSPDVRRCIDEYLDAVPLPDAIIAANDQIALIAMERIRARGLRLPGDIMLAAFEAHDPWNYVDSVCTTIRLPAFELGMAAGTALLERFRSGAFAESDIVLPVTLCEHSGTTG